MKVSRRFFLKSTGALLAYCGFTPNQVLANVVQESKVVTKNKTLVVIFLRGGMDGLNFIIPYGDSHYYDLRSSIAIPRPGEKGGAVELDGFFGLHPRALALQELFQKQQTIALHAVGYAHNTRSHFEEQDVWETGLIGNTIHSDGWLNRHLLTSKGHGPIRALALGNTLPRILRGDAPAYAIRGLKDLETKSHSPSIHSALEHAYCDDMHEKEMEAYELLSQSGKETLEGMKILQKVAQTPYKPKIKYPTNSLGQKLQETARLIKAQIGLEVVEIDYGGWDTHQNQGGVYGNYGNLVQGLADGLSAFQKDLENEMDNVVVLTLSDFGRTARQNGTGGTDHGWANCMLVMGGPVNQATPSKPVITKWPGLAPEQLHQKRDLLHTIDFRDVLAEIVSQHLGNNNLKKVIPQHTFQDIGII